MMRRRDFFAVAAIPVMAPRQRASVFQHENVLRTSLELRLDSLTPDRAEGAALLEIDRLAKILSSYDASSEVSRWTRTLNEPVVVSRELMEVLGLYDEWRTRTGGAISAGFAVANGGPHWKLDRANGIATHLTRAPLV